jgi:hypothetical protein
MSRRIPFVLSAFAAVLGLGLAAFAQDAQSRWPVTVQTDQGTITVFQPQLDDFEGDTLKGRAAVSIEQTGQPPIFGAVWIQSRVAVDRVARTVQIQDVAITQSHFPDGTPNQDALTGAIRQVFVGHPTTLSLDQLLTMLQTVKKQQAEAVQLQSTPPKIVFLDHPAVKVQFDGSPKLLQVDNSNLMRVANTPFFVVLNPADKTYYLKGAGLWFQAADPMGPYQDAKQVPPDVSALAVSSGYADPTQPLTGVQAASIEIVTATDPTELIWTDGPAQMATIPGTDLLYITNTDSDVFMDIQSQQLFVLLSGRWYTASNHEGPWTFVAPNALPADFARIPPNSDKGNVLASVAGTQAAQDAVADSYVPQTASVNIGQYDQPPVQYDGDPQFQPIEGTPMSYAVNTDASVLQTGGQYYCCYDGVWYNCLTPTGNWQLCLSVPQVIYTIPPSCPLYPVRYCYVYGHTGDVVYCGYLPGYTGCYVYDGVVIYGTGWHYNPWFGRFYFPRPWTYGFAARFNCYTNQWGFDFIIGFGGGRSWIGSHPGRFVRSGGGWFGPGGFRPVFRHDLPHETAAQREFAFNQVQRDAYHRSVYDERADMPHAPAGAPQPRVEAGRGSANDVFADRSGQVYRRTIDGWEQHQADGWHPAQTVRPAEPVRPAPAAPRQPEVQPRQDFNDLNQDYRARVDGNARADTYQAPPREEAPREEAPRQEAPRQEAPRSEPPPSGGGGGGGGRR